MAGNVDHGLATGAPTSVAEIWQGPLRRFRETHRRHVWDDLPELCQNCVDWQAVGASSYTPDGQVYHSVAATS